MAVVEAKYWTGATNSYRENPAWALARALHYSAMDGFNAHSETIRQKFNQSKEQGSTMLNAVYAEYIVLFMHLTSRQADAMLGADNVRKIQSLLLPHIAENAQSYYEGSSTSVMRTLGSLANAREQDYSMCIYWLPPTPDYTYSDPKATMYVFQKHIAALLGKDMRDPLELMDVAASTTKGLLSFSSMIDLKEWLKGLAVTAEIANYDSINLAPPAVN